MQLYTPAKWAPRSVIHGGILVIPYNTRGFLNQNQLMVDFIGLGPGGLDSWDPRK